MARIKVTSEMQTILRLLSSEYEDVFCQGVEIAEALDIADLWNKLAVGVRIGENGRVRIPSRNVCHKIDRRFRAEMALRALRRSGQTVSGKLVFAEPSKVVFDAIRGTRVEMVEIGNGASLRALDVDLPVVKELVLCNAPGLATLNGLQGLARLQILEITNCRSLSDLRALGGLQRLKHLRLEGAEALETLDGLQGMARLKILEIKKYQRLTDLRVLRGLPALRRVRINGVEVPLATLDEM
jgi:hypothetical protein